jgi:nucleoside-diphosphate-sugar epimerase
MCVLVTGATGFVGKAVCKALLDTHIHVIAVSRKPTLDMLGGNTSATVVEVQDIVDADWLGICSGVQTVIHLAARVHQLNDSSTDPLADYRQVNVIGTERIAKAAAAAGVKRFIFLSSVKVNGDATDISPFSENDIPHPSDPYATSKWEAEQVLWKIAAATGMDVVIIRPPLIYGPGVKANFLKMMRSMDKGVPLPLACANNQRSLIYLDNLVDALITVMKHPMAVGNTYMVSDGIDVSTPALLHEIAVAMGKSAKLWRCSERTLSLAAKVIGKSAEIHRLFDSLQVESSKIHSELEWVPPYSFEQGIQATVDWYLKAARYH